MAMQMSIMGHSFSPLLLISFFVLMFWALVFVSDTFFDAPLLATVPGAGTRQSDVKNRERLQILESKMDDYRVKQTESTEIYKDYLQQLGNVREEISQLTNSVESLVQTHAQARKSIEALAGRLERSRRQHDEVEASMLSLRSSEERLKGQACFGDINTYKEDKQAVVSLQTSYQSLHSDVQEALQQLGHAMDVVTKLPEQQEQSRAVCSQPDDSDQRTARLQQEMEAALESIWAQERRDLVNEASSGALQVAQRQRSVGSSLWSALKSPALATPEGPGKPDWAQRGAGSEVVHALTSPTFTPPDATLWQRSMGWLGVENGLGVPEDAISADTALGHCWPMAGTNGSLTVRLGTPLVVEAISLDHVGRSEALDTSSAPFHFQAFGLSDLSPNAQEMCMVQGKYELEGPAVQTFRAASVMVRRPFRYVRLQIDNNHGNADYTCLYRLRVHGFAPAKVQRGDTNSP
jgi:hypothetical protein